MKRSYNRRIATEFYIFTPGVRVASRINREMKRVESVDVTISPKSMEKNVKFRRRGECHGTEYRRRRRRCAHVETGHDEYLNK